jgi:hypothetical protein
MTMPEKKFRRAVVGMLALVIRGVGLDPADREQIDATLADILADLGPEDEEEGEEPDVAATQDAPRRGRSKATEDA